MPYFWADPREAVATSTGFLWTQVLFYTRNGQGSLGIPSAFLQPDSTGKHHKAHMAS
ncbi:hypothetical protein I79_017361 [Cricetulus griseus]|uniref:Uncharacterized protein n=1 Tax=Cricetulus griseus TaxID=10029 RepID=G3I1U3_CRIGR|nr:hypothetical protein I79_017361 [Cricetulus griseus]